MFFTIMTSKKLKRICAHAYEQGVERGYELGWQMRIVEETNKGFIIRGKVAQDIEEILKKEK